MKNKKTGTTKEIPNTFDVIEDKFLEIIEFYIKEEEKLQNSCLSLDEHPVPTEDCIDLDDLQTFYQHVVDLVKFHIAHPRGDGAVRKDGTRHVSTPINDARLTLQMARLLDRGPSDELATQIDRI